MDNKDREIINFISRYGFPICSEPFKEIGNKLWLDEVSVISRIVRMLQTNEIKHFGAFINPYKLGYKGYLVAMSVPTHRIDEVANVVNSIEQISHNYLRDDVINMWFTVVVKNEEELKQIINFITNKTRIDKFWIFPTKRVFKVKVDRV